MRVVGHGVLIVDTQQGLSTQPVPRVGKSSDSEASRDGVLER